MASGREIALGWLAAQTNCSSDKAYRLRVRAEIAAEGFDQAEADIAADTVDTKRGISIGVLAMMEPDPEV